MTLNENRLIATKIQDSSTRGQAPEPARMIIGRTKTMTTWLLLPCLLFIFTFSFPQTTEASILSSLMSLFSSSAVEASASDAVESVVTTNSNQVLEAAISSDPNPSKLETEPVVVSDSALLSESGPTGAVGNITDTVDNGQISVYTVHQGDNITTIAKMFGVSVNTILWANNITAKSLKVGQNLVILPVSGVQYTVKKGDTIKSIANKFKGDVTDILDYNGLTLSSSLSVGDEIIIPDGEMSTYISITPSTSVPGAAKNPTSILRGSNVPRYPGFYIRPVSCVKTQGLHGWNAVDLGCKVGTPVAAAAAGTVIISKYGGYNGGYGNYVVISHSNGTQTLYGHLLSPNVYSGQKVTQGQIIGYTGNTGKSTGPHLHFEIRGGKNPF